MFLKKFYYIFLVSLTFNPQAFSNSFCKDTFSKILYFIKGETRGLGRPASQFFPPPTNLLEELSVRATQVYSSFLTYHFVRLEYGDSRVLQNEYIYKDFFEEANHSMLNIGDSYYWSRYVPKKNKRSGRHIVYSGQFILGFAIKLQSAHPSITSGYFYHRIHWESGARDKQIDQETIKEIFTNIYNGSPEKAVKEFQAEFIKGGDIARKEVDRFIVPFLYSSTKAKKVKEIILTVLQKKGYN